MDAIFRLLSAVLFAVFASVSTSATAGVFPVPGQTLEGTRSIADLLAQPSPGPVHIVFVHGMRVPGAGTSNTFQTKMCEMLKDCVKESASPGNFLDIGPRPSAEVVGRQVWTSDEEWGWSRPFIDRSVYRVSGSKKLIVDELNWWPLVFPLKYRFLLMPEIALSGADKQDLALCARTDKLFHPWVTQAEIDAAISRRSSHAGGARINNFLKQQVMNWGLSDAVIVLGPMQEYLHTMVEKAFEFAKEGDAGAEANYVVVCESLGGFVVMDAFASPTAPATVNRILKERTYDLYFFANQFSLLSLGRLWNTPNGLAQEQAVHSTHTSRAAFSSLEKWADDTTPGRNRFFGKIPGRHRQIIAFNDPSDVLTYEVPDVKGAQVVNLYTHNSMTWFGLLENPMTAHSGYSQNHSVLKTLFKRRLCGPDGAGPSNAQSTQCAGK
jgi:hypothetical protein